MNIFPGLLSVFRSIVFLCLVFISLNVKAQSRIVKHYTQRVDTIDLSDDNYILRGKEGFTAFLPEKGRPLGSIVFFMGQTVDVDSKIDEMLLIPPAMKKSIAVIFITSGNYLDFYFDERDLEKIDSTVNDFLKRTHVPKDKLMFAGLSLAGTRAMKYAIHCEQNKSKFKIHPKALLLCDSPLDMIRFWEENSRAIVNNNDTSSKNTGLLITQYLLIGLQGTPENKRDKFINYSPFCYSDSAGGNAKYLNKISVRAYHEPDINWNLENRGKDYYGMNSFDMAGLINQLKHSGNPDAELITTNNNRKKWPNNGSPHTWLIVDNNELVDWFVGVLSKKQERRR
jgi:hypothetical protein